MNRSQFIRRLEAALAVTPANQEEQEEAEIWAAMEAERLRRIEEEDNATRIPVDEEDDSDSGDGRDRSTDAGGSVGEERRREGDEATFASNVATVGTVPKKESNSHVFSHRAREKHFKYRIHVLEQRIKALYDETFQIEANRTYLTALMHGQQKHQLALQLEKDRLKNFRGDSITSSVLHGAIMRYDVESFTVDVHNAYESCLSTIATSKRQLIEGETRKKAIRRELEVREAEVKNRIAAFSHFTTQREKVSALVLSSLWRVGRGGAEGQWYCGRGVL